MDKNVKQSNKQEFINYDAKSDVLYFGLKKGLEEEVVEVAPGINVELDELGKIIGIEILNASKAVEKVGKKKTKSKVAV